MSAAADALGPRPGTLRERDLEEALGTSLERQGPVSEVHRQFSLTLADLWEGRVGPVDLAVVGLNPALVELKWAELPACAWDCLKLAAALVKQQDARGFIVAAAPVTTWENGALGSELFSDRRWPLEDLLGQYAEWFAHWREDVANYPKRLPAAFGTNALAVATTEIGGEQWEIRLAEVEVADPALRRIRYVPTIPSGKLGNGTAGVDPERSGTRHLTRDDARWSRGR